MNALQKFVCKVFKIKETDLLPHTKNMVITTSYKQPIKICASVEFPAEYVLMDPNFNNHAYEWLISKFSEELKKYVIIRCFDEPMRQTKRMIGCLYVLDMECGARMDGDKNE